MKVRASVKPMCEKCKVVKRKSADSAEECRKPADAVLFDTMSHVCAMERPEFFRLGGKQRNLCLGRKRQIQKHSNRLPEQ